MNPHSRSLLALALTAAAAFLPAAPAAAQMKNVPNALQGFATNRDQPIKIDANSLEVRDKEKAAVFSGNVVVVQGDTTLRCKELVVFYDGKEAAKAAPAAPGAAPGAAPAKPGTAAKPGAPATNGDALASGAPISSSAIRRLEINGGVIVTTKEQTATGDQGIFETRSNTITLTGKPVVLTSGPNIIRGQKLTVDLVSGTSRFDGGRIESLIVPNSVNDGQLPGGAKPGAPGTKPPAAKPKPAQ